MKGNTVLDRMRPKSLNGLMASHFQNPYTLSPQAAETICRDTMLVRNIFGQPSRAEGQIIYYAVKDHFPALPEHLLNLSRHPARSGDIARNCLVVKKARELLGWRPETDLKDGIRLTLQWFESVFP